ncbi:MAG: Periplasmic protein involved in polysaccharide export, partial [Chthonomonadales bacterium]|nr:Periplasmic protein involved in polysaccharide export [Chthonomonadales bacterium]
PKVKTGNPFVLGDGANNAPPPTQDVPKKEFQDYTGNRIVGPPDVQKGRDLPLFGYDFFRQSREVIDAHREIVKNGQRYKLNGNSSNGSNDNSGRNNDNNRSDGSGRRTNGTTGTGNTGRRTNDSSNSGNRSDNTERDPTDPNRTDPLNINRTTTDAAAIATTRSSDRNNRADDAENIQGPDTRMEVSDPLTQMMNNVASSVPANYQLAPGDTVVFDYWSPTVERSRLARTLDPQGAISIEGLEPIVLLGKTVASAENTLKERLGRFYKGVQVSLTLNKLRTIQVTVVGNAYQPGTYSVPSVASAYNLLFFAGGPIDSGSLRDIQLFRGGKKVGSLDMYKFELGTAPSADYPLQAGDVLLIPPRKSRIVVRGEVLNPAVYELTETETLEDALRYAGGTKATGVVQSVRINTLSPGNARIIQDVNVQDATAVKAQKLYDGDEVEVFSVRAQLSNSVAIQGAVDQPNDYPLTPNMRVSDLVNRSRGLLNEAYLQHAELRRWNPDTTTTLLVVDLDKALAHDPQNDLVLQKWDQLKVYTREEVAYLGRRYVTIKGAVQKEGIYPVSRNMHVSDLLREAGGTTPDATLEKAFLIHQPDNAAPISVPVNLRAAMRGDKSQDAEIQDNDQLLVYNVRQTQFVPDQLVQIVGQVVTPGNYARTQNMKLSELITFAGGYLPGSAQEIRVGHARHSADDPADRSVKLIHLQAGRLLSPQDDIVLQDGDVVSVPGIGGFLPNVQKVYVRGAVQTPGYVILTNKNTHLTEALKQAGGLRPEAFPQGAEFNRNPALLGSATQKDLTMSLALLNDLLNGSDYQRQVAKSRLDIIKATGQAQQGSIIVPNSTAAALPNAAADDAGKQLANSSLVTKARSNTELEIPDGNIAVNFPLALQRPGTTDDIILLDGDTITIPERPTTVQVIGAVYHKRGVQYRPGETLQQYVDEAGGFTPDAAKDRIEVIRVGGGLVPARKAGKIQPGDVILVPTKVLATKISSNTDYITQFFSSLTSSVLVYKLATSLFGL